MPQYLTAIYFPDNYVPSLEDEALVRDIDTLGKEVEAAGIEVFAGGLEPVAQAKTLRKQPNGEVVVTDGPYLEAKEHIGGLSILEVADMDEALAWTRKGVIACRAPFEVRAFLQMEES